MTALLFTLAVVVLALASLAWGADSRRFDRPNWS